MSEINTLIKELRNKTGAGFLDCKKALGDNDNNIEKSIEHLRKKGLAKASKKSDREANEGAVGIYYNDDIIVLIKVNSETDFAAKSETFLNFLDTLGKLALDSKDTDLTKEKYLKLKYNETSILDYFNSMIAKIGENLILKDLIVIHKKEIQFSYYIHNSYKENIGKIISVINFSSKINDDKVNEFAKNLCMHIAAMKPESLDKDDLDENIIINEKKIQKDLIISSGKPSNIVDKILDGKMKKFYSDVTLLNQNFILDQEKSVKEVIDEYSDKYEFKLLKFKLVTL